MVTKWIIPERNEDTVRRLGSALHVSETTAAVLANRGLDDPGEARRFLQPTLHELEDPCEHPVMVEAARFLIEAARAGKQITIFGDYDADGITAATLLMRCFKYLGANAGLYIPHRIDEGYGLNSDAIRELASTGTNVLVTVDCGISAPEQVRLANELGMETVITDHHQPNGNIPSAAHVLNPKLPDCGFGYEYLAGVGVAFKLVWAIGQQLAEARRVSDEFRDLLMEALSLVALGTVADMVPLVDENRVLARYGLRTLTAAASPGLRALLSSTRLGEKRCVSAEDVAFRLAPRLNAAGRMGDASAAVEMLTTTDTRHATDLAEHLEQQNRLRIKAQREALNEAEEMLAGDPGWERRPCIVLSASDWHQGVVGLVASRLAERHWRPAFVFATDGESASGSARSIPGVPLFDIVKGCAGLLERYGGHEGAAGLTLRVEQLPAFTEKINGLMAQFRGVGPAQPELRLDGTVCLCDLTADLLRELDMLEPFGQGNPQPAFAADDLRIVGSPRIVGSNQNHLAFMVRQDRTTLRCIGMGKADWLDEFLSRRDETFSLAFEPTLNHYMGRTSVELRAEDRRWSGDRCVERAQ